MNHCPNCGSPVTPPSHEGDECYQCKEPIGLWHREETYEESGMPSDIWINVLLGAAVLATLCMWFLEH